MIQQPGILRALQDFADAVTAKMTQTTAGEPEEQIRAPFEAFMKAAAEMFGWNVICVGETTLPDRLGRPDFAVQRNDLLAGYVELKAPGVGVSPSRFKGHNLEQFRRFCSIPNILYTDGNEWALYRNGELVNKVVRLKGDVASEGRRAIQFEDVDSLENLLRDFLLWNPIIPTDRLGAIDLKGLASLLAPLCRMLRGDVIDALASPDSPLHPLAKDWRQLLFPDASDDQFADSYAQTVTFALLLGRSEGADPLTLDNAEDALMSQHNLLSRTLQVLTDPYVRGEMSASLDLLLRVIAVVPPKTFRITAYVNPEDSDTDNGVDPWLYFYEDFLAAYDPKLRKDAGAYYTPVEVVRCQVRLIDDLLVNRFGKPLGFADSDVVTLDPAAGTGTYLLGVIEHALSVIESQQGPGAVAGHATELAKNLYGFEIMVGPYAVTELRVSRALRDHGATLPKDGTHVYLTDTLESPNAEPAVLPFYLKPISEQHEKALKVKSSVPVIVCLGNPPYDRHDAIDSSNKSRSGGWVHWGDSGEGRDGILRDFRDPALASGHGVHVRNLYNLYVYFWRWALWKVFEHESAQGPGVVSFITASSYLDGGAFCGMREHIRKVCDEVWILDLGGEGRGTRQSDNVFAIQTPVAIAIAVRSKKVSKRKPARVHYARIEGSRAAKLATLDTIDTFTKVKWEDCPDEWQAPFRPAGKGDYFAYPLLTDLMPWQHSGPKLHRTWPICHEQETLKKRWRNLLDSADMATIFRETDDRRVTVGYNCVWGESQPALSKLPADTEVTQIERYAYRSFDRQWIIADTRLADRFRPTLWHTHSSRQIYLTSLFSQPLGSGPALTASALIPDIDHFRGSYGAKAVFPLYRDSDASEANIHPGLLGVLATTYKRNVTPEDFLAYIYGVLAQPAFTEFFHNELDTRELRVPFTKDAALFKKVSAVGARLLWLHTYGERFAPKSPKQKRITGVAKCFKAIPQSPDGYPDGFKYNEATQTLHVGEGEFAPVSPEVFAFEVSGLKVVQSWLKYRMKQGAGKKSSPLDDIRPERWTSQFTMELLELLWVLEATVKGYPEQARLLEQVLAGECLCADDLEPPPDDTRLPPGSKGKKSSSHPARTSKRISRRNPQALGMHVYETLWANQGGDG